MNRAAQSVRGCRAYVKLCREPREAFEVVAGAGGPTGDFGDAPGEKVREHNSPVHRDQDIFGTNCAVRDALLMCIDECRPDGADDVVGFADLEPLRQQMVQYLA
jgi:hypothetical protein